MATPPPPRHLAKTLSRLASVPDALQRLDAIHAAQEALEQMAREAVDEARATGTTWKQIGAVYGVSKQAAQQRFRRRGAGSAVPGPARPPETASSAVPPDA